MTERKLIVASVACLVGLAVIGLNESRAQNGACCLGDGTCVETDATGCNLGSGEFLGAGTTCAGTVCDGACCMADETCTEGSADACVAGVFQGAASTCATHCPGTLGTGFTYQGQLKQNGQPVTDTIDLDATLWSAQFGGVQIGGVVILDNVQVVNGLFTVELDFGSEAFDGSSRFLELAVRRPHDPSNTAPFTPLTPRQRLTTAPYALLALQTRGIVADEAGTEIRIGNSPALRLLAASFDNDFLPNVLAGHASNEIGPGAFSATVSGGGSSFSPNRALRNFSTVGGGSSNTADGSDSTVSGGAVNTASGSKSTVAGGLQNDASGDESSVGGGRGNTASLSYSTVGGGLSNTASGSQSTVAGGRNSRAGGGSWSNSSDRRLKKNIHVLTGALEKLLALHGVTFEYKEPQAINELSGQRIGMVAQDVEPVFPDWVDENARGHKTVTYRGFEALTVEALRELRSEKDRQLAEKEERISGLEKQNTELAARLERIEKLLAAAVPDQEKTT